MDKYIVEVDCDGDMDRSLNGRLHCDTGPAMEDIWGYRAWYIDGVKHRDESGGPAVIYSNGDREWYLHGEWLTEAEFCSRTIK